MQFINRTALHAQLYTGFTGPTDGRGMVVARMTWRIGNDGEVYESDARWPIFSDALQTKAGKFPSDAVPTMPGCAVVVVGTARAASPVTQLSISLNIGTFSSRLEVIGSRVWKAHQGELIATEPEPFVEMPLAWENAYGGTCDHEGLKVKHPLNPKGTGFFLRMEQGVGKRLPNLEWPQERIEKWDSRPTPGCWAPVEDSLAWQMAEVARALSTTSDEDAKARLLAEFRAKATLLAAQPRMVAPDLRGGDKAVLRGAEPRPLEFLVPSWSLRVLVDLGNTTREHPLQIAGLWILLDERLLVVTYRADFQYQFVPRQDRSATLLVDTSGSSSRAGGA